MLDAVGAEELESVGGWIAQIVNRFELQPKIAVGTTPGHSRFEGLLIA